MPNTIETIFRAIDQQSATVNRLSEQLEDYGDAAEEAEGQTSGASGALDGLKKAAMAFISIQMAKKVALMAREMGELGAKSKFVSKNFENFANNEGKDYNKMMDSMRSATSGMITDLELQQLSMQAMVGGVDFDQMVVAMEYVSAQALATGQDVSSKMQTVMTGLARGSAQFLDDVGIQVMGAKDVVGAAVDQMKEKVGIFGDAAESAMGKMAASKADIENIKARIGEDLIPVAQQWYTVMADIARVTKEILIDGLKGTDKVAVAEANRHMELIKQHQILKKINKLEGSKEIEASAKEYKELAKDQKMLQKSLSSMSKRTLEDEKKRNVLEDEISAITKKRVEINKEISKFSGGRLKGATEYNSAVKATIELEKKWGIEKAKGKKIDFGGKGKGDGKAAELSAEAKAQMDHDRKIAEWREAVQVVEIQKREAKEEATRENNYKQQVITNDKIIAEAKAMEELITQIKKEELDKRAEEERKAEERLWKSAQMVVTGINQISRAKQQSLAMDSRKEIEAIQKSTMSEKKKEIEIAKIQKRTREEQEKTANVAWAATSALATANAAAAVIDVIKNMPTGPIGKLAAGATIGATVFGLAAQVASSKPKFYNGSNGAINDGSGRTSDGISALIRNGESVLNPAETALNGVMKSKFSRGVTNNTNSMSNSYQVNVTVNGGGDAENIRAVLVAEIPRAIQEADQSNAIDYDQMTNMNAKFVRS